MVQNTFLCLLSSFKAYLSFIIPRYNAAFALLGQGTIDALLADTDTLSDILLYHVISDTKILQDAALTVAQSSDNKVTMTNDRQTALTLANNTPFVNKSSVALDRKSVV